MHRVPSGQSSCLAQTTEQVPPGKSLLVKQRDSSAHSVSAAHAPPTYSPSMPTSLPQEKSRKSRKKPRRMGEVISPPRLKHEPQRQPVGIVELINDLGQLAVFGEAWLVVVELEARLERDRRRA